MLEDLFRSKKNSFRSNPIDLSPILKLTVFLLEPRMVDLLKGLYKKGDRIFHPLKVGFFPLVLIHKIDLLNLLDFDFGRKYNSAENLMDLLCYLNQIYQGVKYLQSHLY